MSRCEGGVAGEGRVVGVPKFHSWDKCTMALMNINSNWMSNASSGLCINLCYVLLLLYYLYYAGPLSCILGCNHTPDHIFYAIFKCEPRVSILIGMLRKSSGTQTFGIRCVAVAVITIYTFTAIGGCVMWYLKADAPTQKIEWSDGNFSTIL